MEWPTSSEAKIYLISYLTNIPLLPPKFINLGLTHRCNLRCRICSTREENPKIEKELKVFELKKLIIEIARWDKKINVSFAGGEPLIRKDDLIECIKFANSLGLNTYMTSNGTLISKEIARELVISGLKYLQISLDGANKKINDLIRWPGSFKGAMRGLRNIIKAKRKMNSNLRISITTVVTNKNLDHLLKIYKLVKKLGLYGVDYNPYNIDTSYVKNKKYEDDEFWVKEENIEKLRKICEKLIKLKKKEGKINTPTEILRLMPHYFLQKEKFKDGFCLAGHTYLYINPYGYADVCGKGPSLSVRKYSLKKIWFSHVFLKTRIKIKRCKRPCLMLCFPRISLRPLK